MKPRSYKDLEVWKRSIALVSETYALTKKLPKSEQFGLVSQAQRSVVSIPSNISEGYARRSTGDYIRFLSIAFGSAAELDTQVVIIKQEYPHIKTHRTEQLLSEVQKMLYALINKLKN